MRGWLPVMVVVGALQMLPCHTFGAYPGTFYQMMLRLNKDRKYARNAPSPSRLWAILDPAASLGSLSHEPITSNRIVRSANFRTWESRQLPNIEPVIGGTTAEPPETAEPSSTTAAPTTTAEPSSTTAAPTTTAEPSVTTSESSGTTAAPSESDTSGTTAAPSEPDTSGTTAAPSETAGSTTPPTSTSKTPEECGGEIHVTAVPSEVTSALQGGKQEFVISSPGWQDGAYPEKITCKWNLNVGEECHNGFLIYEVQDGELRYNSRCHPDVLQVTDFKGVQVSHCGQLVVGTDKMAGILNWNYKANRTATFLFISGPREGNFRVTGEPRGFTIKLTHYCQVYDEGLFPGDGQTTTETGVANQSPSETSAEDNAIIRDSDVASGGGDSANEGSDSGSEHASDDVTSATDDVTNGTDDVISGSDDVSGGSDDVTNGVDGATRGNSRLSNIKQFFPKTLPSRPLRH